VTEGKGAPAEHFDQFLDDVRLNPSQVAQFPQKPCARVFGIAAARGLSKQTRS